MPMSKGVAFADLFDPDVVGDGPTAPGYTVAGVPLKFADIKYGSKRADVGYAESGVDVSNKWAAKGTATYLDPAPGYHWTGAVPHTGSSTYTIASTVTWHPDGTWQNIPSAGGGPKRSGTWSNAGTSPGALYELMLDNFVLTNGAGQTLTLATNDASSWVSLSSDRTAVMQLSSKPSSVGSTWTCRVRIRLASTGAVMYTGTINGNLVVSLA